MKNLLLVFFLSITSLQAYAETSVACYSEDVDYGFISLFVAFETGRVTGSFTDGVRSKGRLIKTTLKLPATPDKLNAPDFSMTVRMPFTPHRVGIAGSEITIEARPNEQGELIFWQLGRDYEVQQGKKKFVIDLVGYPVDCELLQSADGDRN